MENCLSFTFKGCFVFLLLYNVMGLEENYIREAALCGEKIYRQTPKFIFFQNFWLQHSLIVTDHSESRFFSPVKWR